MNRMNMENTSYQPITRQTGRVGDISKYLLPIFILSSMTVSYVAGISKITIIIGVLISAGYTMYHITTKRNIQPEVRIYFLWLIWATSGAFVSVDISVFWDRYFTVFMIAVMIFVIAGISYANRDIKLNFISIIIGVLFILAYSYFTEGLSRETFGAKGIRIASITGNANSLGFAMIFGTFSIMYFWRENMPVSRKVLIYLLIAIFIIGIIASGSRKSFLAEVLFILLWIGYCYRKVMFKSVFGIIGLALLLFVVYSLVEYTIVSTYLGERITEVPDADNRGVSLRVMMYRIGLELIRDNPIFGIGLNNYAIVTGLRMYSHSDYIEVAVSTGLLGFSIYYYSIVLFWLRLNWISQRTQNSVILYRIGLFKASLLIILFLAFGAPFYNVKLTWIYLASAFGYTRYIETQIKKSLDARKLKSIKSRRKRIREIRTSQVAHEQY